MRIRTADVRGDVKVSVFGVGDFDSVKVVQHLVEFFEVSSRGQVGVGGGRVVNILHEVEVAAQEGGEPTRDLGHSVHQRALPSQLVHASVEVTVEEQKSFPSAVQGNILPTLDVTLTKGKRDIDRREVLEDSRGVDNHSACNITSYVIKRNHTPGERGETEPLAQGQARLLKAYNVGSGHEISDSVIGQVFPVKGPTITGVEGETIHVIGDNARHQRGAASERAGISINNRAGGTRGAIPVVN